MRAGRELSGSCWIPHAGPGAGGASAEAGRETAEAAGLEVGGGRCAYVSRPPNLSVGAPGRGPTWRHGRDRLGAGGEDSDREEAGAFNLEAKVLTALIRVTEGWAL